MRLLRMMVLGGGVGMAFSTVFADASGNTGDSHGNFIAVVEFAPRLRAVYHPGE